jgi:hypothetical protein
MKEPDEVAIHGGIESTLVVLGRKLEHIDVITEFDRSLPTAP